MSTPANWFIALPVTAEQLPRGLLDAIPTSLRRFHSEDLHITLAFLGAVGRERACAAWSCVAPMGAPGPVATGELAAFGRPERPSAYGLDLTQGNDALVGLIARWRNVLREAAGVAPETRTVRPHVTFARPPRRSGEAARAAARHWLEQPHPATVTLHPDRVALYTRAESPSERLFQRIAEQDLPA